MNTMVFCMKAFKLLLTEGHDTHLAIEMYKLVDRLPQEVVHSYFSVFRKDYPLKVLIFLPLTNL